MSTATEHGALSATLLLDPSVIDDPYAFYRRLVAEAPVWCVPDTEIVIVSSYDAVTEIVSRVDDFSSNSTRSSTAASLAPPSCFLSRPVASRPWPLPTHQCTRRIATRCSRSSSPAAWRHSAQTSKRWSQDTLPRRCRDHGSR